MGWITPKQPHCVSRRGFTLVEVMVVVLIIGVLAAVAVIAFSGNKDEAHTVEATTNLDALGKGAQLYFQERHTLAPNTSPISGTYPHNAQCTSTGNKLGAAEVPSAVDFAQLTTFSALYWSISKPHYYQFCYIPDPMDGNLVKGFTLFAVASLRGVGDSVFIRRGDIDANGGARVSGIQAATLEDLPPFPSNGRGEHDKPSQPPSAEAALVGADPAALPLAGGAAGVKPLHANAPQAGAASNSPTQLREPPLPFAEAGAGGGDQAGGDRPRVGSVEEQTGGEPAPVVGGQGGSGVGSGASRSRGENMGATPPTGGDDPKGRGCALTGLRR